MWHLGPFTIQRETERVAALVELRDRERAKARAALDAAEQALADERAARAAWEGALVKMVSDADLRLAAVTAERDRLRGIEAGMLGAVPLASWN